MAELDELETLHKRSVQSLLVTNPPAAGAVDLSALAARWLRAEASWSRARDRQSPDWLLQTAEDRPFPATASSSLERGLPRIMNNEDGTPILRGCSVRS